MQQSYVPGQFISHNSRVLRSWLYRSETKKPGDAYGLTRLDVGTRIAYCMMASPAVVSATTDSCSLTQTKTFNLSKPE